MGVADRVCSCGHTHRQHEIRSGGLFGCYISGCLCIDFTEDPLWESVAEVRDECRDDPLAADIAEALVRYAGMRYLDMTSPETAAHIAAKVARAHLGAS